MKGTADDTRKGRTMTARPLGLGTHVAATDTLVRVDRPGAPYHRKEWVRHRDQYPGDWCKPQPVEGIVVGRRHLANGTVHWWGEDGTTFRRTDGVTAYLIAYDMHRCPVLALVDDVTERGA